MRRPRLGERRVERLEPSPLVELGKVHAVDTRPAVGCGYGARRRLTQIDDEWACTRSTGYARVSLSAPAHMNIPVEEAGRRSHATSGGWLALA